MTIRILVGDCRDWLARLPAQSIHACVTSFPYYGKRDYRVPPTVWGGDAECQHEWGDALRTPWANEISGPSENVGKNGASKTRPKTTGPHCVKCNAWRGAWGLEPTVEQYVLNCVEVCRAIWRVLRDDATFWLNLGDSYAGSGQGWQKGAKGQFNRPWLYDYQGTDGRGRPPGYISAPQPNGIKPKDLMLIPARVALALQADGWYVRSEITWAKTAPMPESVQDRPTCATEVVFLLTKSPRYFYDAVAVAEPSVSERGSGNDFRRPARLGFAEDGASRESDRKWEPTVTRNMRNWWLLGPEPLKEAHYAAYPTEVARRAIAAGTSEKGCCPHCGAPWVRETVKTFIPQRDVSPDRLSARPKGEAAARDGQDRVIAQASWNGTPHGVNAVETTAWRASCACPPHAPIPCTVLDSCCGSGTSGLVASRLGRHAILCELNPDYAEMARRRIQADAPLITNITVETLTDQRRTA